MKYKLKKEFINLLPFGSDYIAFENWITKNYILREDVEELKLKYIYAKLKKDKQFTDGYNAGVDENNQNINNLLEKNK